jgi:hypothetical protein
MSNSVSAVADLTLEMTVAGTPVRYWPDLGLFVKHEEECCPGGPHFSKTRGVWAHAATRPEPLLGVLDTSHSQGGYAVARAAKLLGKQCIVYYPIFKTDRGIGPSQSGAVQNGAQLCGLPATASWALYHKAKKDCEERGGYMFPNALKLIETVEETARELERTIIPTEVQTVLISASSGTIAAGVLAGLGNSYNWFGPRRPPATFPFIPTRRSRNSNRRRAIVHLGYSRSEVSVRQYITRMAGWAYPYTIIDEGYKYTDAARSGPTPDFPCSKYYDLKALRWAIQSGMTRRERILLWNIG